ncbi:MAG: DNA-binding response regulator [Lachnospiraceae bacterium]|uniref:Stage 0 sporulation protein A homolog n=1 Tax=Candidatus Weimeria bifida TaxID=2599074 RepID=A0A6N7J145_9FIRM|nr:response regulator transcription factor [Candidatus Weimeria bifida]RRF97351.1 MAG: DNA-binding response regulator [Lachnospiraceae bacterium]
MRILLADDEEELTEPVAAVLKKNNYSVDIVNNGDDAYDYLTGASYDAAILDIMMPGMSGLEVLKKIRAEGSTLPVLLLTAKSEIDDRVEGLDAGADDYLPKPFAMKELLARLRSITRRTAETKEVDLSFGDITLDRKKSVLNGPKGSEELSSKEFQMLEMLMLNHDTFINQDTFMEKIWGLDSDTDDRVVFVYISYVRNKLKAAGSKVTLKTKRGLGYFLKE